jgi:hypothetical protein
LEERNYDNILYLLKTAFSHSRRGGSIRRRGGSMVRRRGGSMVEEERCLNGSAPDCKSVGSNPAPPQHTANSVSPKVGSHLGITQYRVLASEGRQRYIYTKTSKTLKIYRKKRFFTQYIYTEELNLQFIFALPPSLHPTIKTVLFSFYN